MTNSTSIIVIVQLTELTNDPDDPGATSTPIARSSLIPKKKGTWYAEQHQLQLL